MSASGKPDRAVVPAASSPQAVSPVPASIPSALALTEAECNALIGIPTALRKERGWSGSRSVGMLRLIEERLHAFLAERLRAQMAHAKATETLRALQGDKL